MSDFDRCVGIVSAVRARPVKPCIPCDRRCVPPTSEQTPFLNPPPAVQMSGEWSCSMQRVHGGQS